MNSKRLNSRLNKMGYSLTSDIFGWIVVSWGCGTQWRFPTLGGVNRFVTEKETRRMNNSQG